MLVLLLTLHGSLALAADEGGLRALETGDCATAIATLSQPQQDAERLALARCQARLGQADQALALLGAIEDPGLAGYAALVRGEALAAAGRWPEAAAALEGTTLPGSAGEGVALLRGRALIEGGDYAAARSVLSGLLSGPLGEAGHLPGPGGADPGEVRWWLAQGAIRRGEPDKAVGVLQTAWARNPSSPFAAQAEAWLAAQGQPVDEVATAAGRALVAARASTLEHQRLYPEALALLDRLGGTRSDAEEARLAFRAKDYPRAVAAFARLASPTPAQRFDHALATSRTGDYAAAAALYQALIDAAPASPEADQASYKLGYLAYDAGDLERAIPLLQAHLGRYPRSRYADDARWFIAWSQYKLGQLDAAEAGLAALASGSTALAPQAAYWRAHARADRGDQVGARAAWQQLVDRWPDSAAAWQASQRLGLHLAGIPTQGPAPVMPPPLRSDAWRRGSALARVGLDPWARAELQPLEDGARAAGKEARLALALALVEAGDYRRAQDLARPWCGTPWKAPGAPWALRACFPRPHAEVIDAIALPAGLDPLLPVAIMNAESGLDPSVTSLAGARGLMQMMPALAAEQHRKRFGDSPYDPDALYDSGYNSALGTTELVDLQARLGPTGVQPLLPLVIAGYNGGADAVERWVGSLPAPREGDRFAEDVGYTETRVYVRRVLGYLQQYRYVYGDGGVYGNGGG